MHKKITFILLFVFSFIVMHDSVLNIISETSHHEIAHFVQKQENEHQKIMDIQQVHSMFHFVALTAESLPISTLMKKMEPFENAKSVATQDYQESSTKPPIPSPLHA